MIKKHLEILGTGAWKLFHLFVYLIDISLINFSDLSLGPRIEMKSIN